MRWLTLIMAACLLGVSGCQRDSAQETEEARGQLATHPWELPDWQLPNEVLAQRPDAAADFSEDEQVKTPTLRGPLLPESDTLDPELIPGRWLQVCMVSKENLALVPVGEMDMMELRPDGKGAYHVVSQGEAQTLEGNWEKLEPGILSIGFSGEMLPMYSELRDQDFLYIWNYEQEQGIWFVRLPQAASSEIEANLFDTTRGRMHFQDVVSRSYSGVVEGESELNMRGFYESGILTMRWEDEQNNVGGYAAFRVEPGWQELHGYWWIDDYEAAPFGGVWDCTRANP
ncbi:hypothetical protein JW859_01470 [bacterium]|nr:hypothetical protein [bacterium]